jgi:hypothetical protein
MNIIKPIGTVAFVVFSAAAMAAPDYPSAHMTDTLSGDTANHDGAPDAEQRNSAGMAAPDYPSEHMTNAVSGDTASHDTAPGTAQRNSVAEARNEITARPTPVAPAAPADPMYRADNYPHNTGWMRAAEAQRANGVSPEKASADISARPTPVAPAAPADPKFVPSS